MTKLPDGAQTLYDDEGVGYTRDAFEAASRGEVIWCVASDRAVDDPPALAVMISPAALQRAAGIRVDV